MKQYLLAALVGLMVMPGAASAHMMDWNGNDATRTPVRQEMRPQLQTSGMMTTDKDTDGDCTMHGGMIGSGTGSWMSRGNGYGTMPGTVSMIPDEMMHGQSRGIAMMAAGMMPGQVDFGRMRTALALSDEQAERLRTEIRPFQREAILTLASLNVAELELADLLAADEVDVGRIEAKLKEIEGVRSKARLSQFKATVAVKRILGTEQMAMLQATGGCTSAPPAAAEGRRETAPRSGSEHHMDH